MNGIQGVQNIAGTTESVAAESAVTKSSNAFSDMLKNIVNDTNQTQAAGDKAMENLQAGKAQHLHDVMISVEEAEISLKMLVQMRNKALAAYEEIMRMQV